MLNTKTFYPLTGGVRHYAWGECASQGKTPFIADLLKQEPGEEPWAELWLGAHPSLPGLLDTPEGTLPLNQAIAQAPKAWLGERSVAVSEELPFLLKVLTCSAPLSIQSHPDAQSAVRLHAARPDLYPDAHDKTEIMIALEPFQALAGFRGLSDIRGDLEKVEAFQPWLALWRYGEPTLRRLVESLFSLNVVPLAAMLTQALQELQERQEEALSAADRLFLSLSREYPGDRGTLFAYLLNRVDLAPGQALFLAPNSPHAYQRGAGIECMTNSDNVIRAGLTPKAVDVPTLLQTVDFDATGYRMVTPRETSVQGGRIREYPAPTPKFRLFFHEDAPCRLESHPDALGVFLVVRGDAVLKDGQGRSIPAPAGTAWVRPADLQAGAILPAAPGTLVVWAQSAF
ncbi:MAG: mannose-6-phosphate isomerase, class I [Oligosphaeraceae bacterium]